VTYLGSFFNCLRVEVFFSSSGPGEPPAFLGGTGIQLLLRERVNTTGVVREFCRRTLETGSVGFPSGRSVLEGRSEKGGRDGCVAGWNGGGCAPVGPGAIKGAQLRLSCTLCPYMRYCHGFLLCLSGTVKIGLAVYPKASAGEESAKAV